MQLTQVIKNNSIILFLLLTASALRLYGLFDLPYTYDELSAVNRLEFDSFGELITKGVMIDAHPALIQVWMYYYSLLFGTTEWLMKLPFIIMGIASVYVVYDIGKRWFNETAGLLTASLLTCAQYFVFYSVIARPYISGLFLCLLTLKFWLEILFTESPQKKHYVLFAVFATLSALNHHFSMMFAALCGLLGLFFLTKTNFKNYLIACATAVILYAPHFPVLFAQLKIGGIGAGSGGWLDPPGNDFILKFIAYLFHYSWIFALVFSAVIVATYFLSEKNNSTQKNKIRVLLFLLFALSFLIGFFYSLKVNPVIQFSTLIFATPCLLLFFASFAREVSIKLKWASIVLILGVGISTLIFKRQYYNLIFKQAFDSYFQSAEKFSNGKGRNNIFCLFKGEPWFLNFYKKKYNSDVRFKGIEGEALSQEDYKSIYDTLSSRYLVLGDFSPAQLLQASNYYPYVHQKITGYSFELYVLSKDPSDKRLSKLDGEKEESMSLDLKNPAKEFNLNKDLIVHDNGTLFYRIDSLNEYPLSFKIKNTDLKAHEGESIITEINYQSDTLIKGLISSSIDVKKQNVHFTSSDLNAYYQADKKTQTAYLSVYVSATFNEPENEQTIFIWNNQKEKFKVTGFTIYKWSNNPYRYALLSDF
ncbi:MAG: glycosyltransferase family 39 protein [Bacteroidota bacterium]